MKSIDPTTIETRKNEHRGRKFLKFFLFTGLLFSSITFAVFANKDLPLPQNLWVGFRSKTPKTIDFSMKLALQRG